MADMPQYLYRRGYRVKDLVLNRRIDFLTGLSFYDHPVGKTYLQLDVKSLIQNGFVVRPDSGLLVRHLFTDETYIEPNSGEAIRFPDGHVTVWHPDRVVWQAWYENDRANYGKSDVSEQLAYFALAIIREDE